MKKRAILSWLSLLVLIASSAHVPVTLSTPTSASPALPGLSGKADQNATGMQLVVLADSDDQDDEDDQEHPPQPRPPLDSAPETPLVPTEGKPTILDQSNWSPPMPLLPILGYTFPSGTSNWTIPVRAAAFVEITPDPSERFTPVGMVEIGANPETETESQIYLVSIDLASKETRVKGQLVPVTPPDILSVAAADTIDVIFKRIPQKLNPQRTDSPYEEFQGLPTPSDSSATIFADGVCFEVKTDNATNGTGSGGDNDSDDDADNDYDDGENGSMNGGPIYNIYCSRPFGPDGSNAPLSVMDNFPSQYAELQSSIIETAAGFNLEDRIQINHIVSTLESILGIEDCASSLTEEACGSDIIAAPVTNNYFRRQYNKAFGGNGDGNGGDGEDRDHNNGENGDHEALTVSRVAASFAADDDDDNNDDRDDDNHKPNQSPTPITAAVVSVLKPIEYPETESSTQPGDYVLHLWFDSNGVFYAATLSGVTTDETVVTNQQIPGVPATFIDKLTEGPRQPASQISAVKLTWRGDSVCLFRERC